MDDTPYASTYDEADSLLSVVGSVDELAVQTFRADLEKGSDGFGRDLTVDLTRVDFFPSLAIGILAVAANKARQAGQTLDVVAEPGSIVARVLTISRLPYRENL